MSQIKKVLQVKKMHIFIPYRNVPSDLMYLQPLWFYFKSKKITQKMKNAHYLKNGEFDQKDF